MNAFNQIGAPRLGTAKIGNAQPRLPDDLVQPMSWCQAEHRDISLAQT